MNRSNTACLGQACFLALLVACTNLCLGTHAARANFIWAVGDAGTILHSTNSGTSWRIQSSGTGEQLRAVDFVDFGYGWAVGNNGTIRHTNNGGASWTAQSSSTTQHIHAVDFIDRNTGWAVDNTGGVLRTTNGGATWTRTAANNFGALRAVDLVSSSTGWTAGAPYPLGTTALQTTDGGSNWDFYDLQTSSFATITGLDFSDASNGWAVGASNRIYRTTNGGNSWSLQSLSTSGIPAVLNNLDFVEGFSTGVAVGANEAWRTTNGGTWTRTTLASTTLNDVSMLTTNNGWAVGQNGARLRTTNGGLSWSNQTDGTTANLLGVATIFSPGQTASNPFLPSGAPEPESGAKPFDNAPGDGFWFDPPVANYLFETDGNSSFTQVGLPDGTTVPDADLTYQIVSSLGTVSVAAGQTYAFPTPVTTFSILGIDPAVESEDPLAFPVFLQFDAASVSFTMTPIFIPEPGTLTLAALGMALLARRASAGRRRPCQR